MLSRQCFRPAEKEGSRHVLLHPRSADLCKRVQAAVCTACRFNPAAVMPSTVSSCAGTAEASLARPLKASHSFDLNKALEK